MAAHADSGAVDAVAQELCVHAARLHAPGLGPAEVHATNARLLALCAFVLLQEHQSARTVAVRAVSQLTLLAGSDRA